MEQVLGLELFIGECLLFRELENAAFIIVS